MLDSFYQRFFFMGWYLPVFFGSDVPSDRAGAMIVTIMVVLISFFYGTIVIGVGVIIERYIKRLKDKEKAIINKGSGGS